MREKVKMTTVLTIFFAACVIASIIYTVISLHVLVVKPITRHIRRGRLEAIRPIVYICEVNNRVGITLQKDFLWAVSEFFDAVHIPDYDWSATCFYRGSFREPFGSMINPRTVFIFSGRTSSAIRVIENNCVLVKARFYVPDKRSYHDHSELRQALTHFGLSLSLVGDGDEPS